MLLSYRVIQSLKRQQKLKKRDTKNQRRLCEFAFVSGLKASRYKRFPNFTELGFINRPSWQKWLILESAKRLMRRWAELITFRKLMNHSFGNMQLVFMFHAYVY